MPESDSASPEHRDEQHAAPASKDAAHVVHDARSTLNTVVNDAAKLTDPHADVHALSRRIIESTTYTTHTLLPELLRAHPVFETKTGQEFLEEITAIAKQEAEQCNGHAPEIVIEGDLEELSDVSIKHSRPLWVKIEKIL